MKKTFQYKTDVPVWSIKANKVIGWVRTTVHYYFHGSPGNWRYTEGDYDISEMELINISLPELMMNQFNDTDMLTLEKLDTIVNEVVAGLVEQRNADDNAEMEADEAYQRANEADYPTLNRQFIHP